MFAVQMSDPPERVALRRRVGHSHNTKEITMATTQVPIEGERHVWKSGRYERIPNSVYHDEIDALNMSTLKLMDVSPAHCRSVIENPELHRAAEAKKQANLNFGSAIHTIVIEPEVFEAVWAIHPEGNKNSLDYKEAAAELIDEGLTLISQKHWDACHRICDSIHDQDCYARDIIRGKSAGEVSYVVDSDAGIQHKIRPDIMIEAVEMVVDLKSTISANAQRFERQGCDLGYHLSKPFYMEALERAEPGKWKQHLFLAVEKEPPWEFALFDVNPEATDLAYREVDRLLAAFEECVMNDDWPGYPRSVQSMGLPGYEYQRVQKAKERREQS